MVDGVILPMTRNFELRKIKQGCNLNANARPYYSESYYGGYWSEKVEHFFREIESDYWQVEKGADIYHKGIFVAHTSDYHQMMLEVNSEKKWLTLSVRFTKMAEICHQRLYKTSNAYLVPVK